MTCVQNHIKFFCSFRFSSEVKNSDMSFLKSLMTDFCKNQECFVILCSTTINHETSVKYYDKPLRQHELFVVFELHYQEVQWEKSRQLFSSLFWQFCDFPAYFHSYSGIITLIQLFISSNDVSFWQWFDLNGSIHRMTSHTIVLIWVSMRRNKSEVVFWVWTRAKCSLKKSQEMYRIISQLYTAKT